MGWQRGFSLVEVIVAVAVIAATLLWVTALRGTRPPLAHTAALGLQAALVEARSLAMSTSGASGSGAMLTAVPQGSETVLSVYAYRPIPGSQVPVVDTGFVPLRYPVSMTIPGSTKAGQPFSILISSSGYASVAPNYAYDPAAPRALATDPGCNEAAGVTIAVSDGVATETHALDCRETQYEAVP